MELLLGIMMLFFRVADGQGAPAWFASLPDDPATLHGRGAAEVAAGGAAAALEQAKRDALRDLATSLQCRLTSEIIDHQEERGAGGVESRFASRTVVESALDVVNVRTLHEAVAGKMAFVAVAADRAEMARAYRDRTDRLQAAAAAAFARALALEADSEVRAARTAYEECLAARHEAAAARDVYLALTRWKDAPPPPDGIPDTAEIQARLRRLAAETPRTLAEIAGTLADTLTASLPGKAPVRRWFVLPVEFEHTGFVSEFGQQLSAALAAALARHPAVRIAEDPAQAEIRVRGRMLREGESLLLVLQAGDSAVQHYIEPVTCAAIGRSRIEPADLDRLLADKLALHKAMVAPEGLRVELRTDRMHDGPVTYRFGDQPKLAVRADRACTIRLIYVTAKGTRLLLLDRHAIGEHQANQWVTLPLELLVDEPEGVEQLILQAATDERDARLPPLRVRNIEYPGGLYEPVIQDPLDDVMTRTRGVMLRRQSHFAESTYQWTIFKK